MDSLTWNVLLEQRLQKMKDVLGVKAAEYASKDDRLHNFKVAGIGQGISPEAALRGMWYKHHVSVLDMINKPDAGWTDERIDEKIGDSINYLCLLEGLLKERTGYGQKERTGQQGTAPVQSVPTMPPGVNASRGSRADEVS